MEDATSRIDTINGFVEVYLDARGHKGAWESLVYYENPHKTEAMRRIASHARWFEDLLAAGEFAQALDRFTVGNELIYILRKER